MREVRLRAFAKVNYALDVLGLRADGYHEVSTVMQSISLADEVELRHAAGGFDLSLEPEEVEVGSQERNTTYLAWKALQRLTGKELPVKVTLRKEIPAGAGLGGGSANAAAVLVGLNELFALGLRVDKLRGIGARIGRRRRGNPHTTSCATGPSASRRQTAQECGYSRDLPGL
jgi:4-diphosphocytidyl-2-C-methyl-D-erythritol kinase